MKKLLLTILSLHSLFISSTSAQSLPPIAQALYQKAWLQDSSRVKYALEKGAKIFATPDGNSFYVQWFPENSNASTPPLIVTLHGSEGFAFHEFFNWYQQAKSHGCGIIALQWFRGTQGAPNDYFDDATIYSYIDSALTRIAYPSNKAFLHGFSRGSARSYAIVFKDAHGGKNYFSYILSNAGTANPNYPLYAQINDGKFGSKVFNDKHWALFCGGLDPNARQSGCEGMGNAKKWLETQGAIVDLFIQDPALGHNGFHLVPAYMDSVLNNYLKYFHQ